MAYQYFVVPNYDGGDYTGAAADARRYGRTPVERETFDGLWRCAGDDWEYFSLLDRDWHPQGTAAHLPADDDDDDDDDEGPAAPGDNPDWRLPVDADRAAALTADFDHFTRFWIDYEDGVPGTRVFRQVETPERSIRGFFANGLWSDWSSDLHDFLTNGPHQRPTLVELDPAEADKLIQEVHGITGAAGWWPRMDPDAFRFVVSDTFDVSGRGGTLVTGRLERGVVRPPVTVHWEGTYASGVVRAVEFPSPGSTARGEVTLVVDHPGRALDPGSTLSSLPYVSKPLPVSE